MSLLKLFLYRWDISELHLSILSAFRLSSPTTPSFIAHSNTLASSTVTVVRVAPSVAIIGNSQPLPSSLHRCTVRHRRAMAVVVVVAAASVPLIAVAFHILCPLAMLSAIVFRQTAKDVKSRFLPTARSNLSAPDARFWTSTVDDWSRMDASNGRKESRGCVLICDFESGGQT